jgi:hypothetical protein
VRVPPPPPRAARTADLFQPSWDRAPGALPGRIPYLHCSRLMSLSPPSFPTFVGCRARLPMSFLVPLVKFPMAVVGMRSNPILAAKQEPNVLFCSFGSKQKWPMVVEPGSTCPSAVRRTGSICDSAHRIRSLWEPSTDPHAAAVALPEPDVETARRATDSYVVPPDFDASVLGQADLSDAREARLSVPDAFYNRYIALRQQARVRTGKQTHGHRPDRQADTSAQPSR